MAITESKLMEAFSLAAAAEFESIPSCETAIEHEFSARFERRMEKLLRLSENSGHGRRGMLRHILIAAAVTVLVFLAACAIPAVREGAAELTVKVYRSFIEFIMPKNTPIGNAEDKTGLCDLGAFKLPEGFTELEVIGDSEGTVKTYSDGDGNRIVFDCHRSDGAAIKLDNEHGRIEELAVGERRGRIYLAEEQTIAVWFENGNAFTLIYNAPIDKTSMEKLIENIN